MKNRDGDKENNIGLLFKGLSKFINIMEDMIENQKDEIDIKGVLNDSGKKDKIVGSYGVNIKLGADKQSSLDKINTFGNMRKSDITDNKVREVLNIIEPVTDIFDEDDKVTIVMELSGVCEEDIQLEIDDELIKVRAKGNGNNYSKNLKLKFKPVVTTVKAVLKNSIYSIVIDKGVLNKE